MTAGARLAGHLLDTGVDLATAEAKLGLAYVVHNALMPNTWSILALPDRERETKIHADNNRRRLCLFKRQKTVRNRRLSECRA